MSDIGEGLGSAIEGALTGRAVEPKQGASGTSGHGSEDCANCGARVTATYCPDCGQRRHVHRSLSAIGHDLLHGVLHLDGKLWDTLPLLTLKPGELTRRYIDGERAKFVSPMAMFLFTVFAMFAVFQMVGLTAPSDFSDVIQSEEQRALEVKQELEAALENEENLTDERRAQLNERIVMVDQAIKAISDGGDYSYYNAAGGRTYREVNITGISTIDDGIIKKFRANPGLMLYKLQAYAYKFSWLLIPLSIPFVWLIFAWKRRFKAYDHAVFVTYSLSFMSLLFIASSLAWLIPGVGEWVVLPLILIPPIHLYKQLRGTYEIGRFGAFWRLLALSLFIWIVLILFLQALLLLGAF